MFHTNKELLFVEFGRNEIVDVPRFLFKYNTYLDEVSFQSVMSIVFNCAIQFRSTSNRTHLAMCVAINSARIPTYVLLTYRRIMSYHHSWREHTVPVSTTAMVMARDLFRCCWPCSMCMATIATWLFKNCVQKSYVSNHHHHNCTNTFILYSITNKKSG